MRRAPALMDLSEWIAFRNRRVASYSQYQLRDDDFWQSGLRFADGDAKPGVYAAFSLPVFVRSLGGERRRSVRRWPRELGRCRPG